MSRPSRGLLGAGLAAGAIAAAVVLAILLVQDGKPGAPGAHVSAIEVAETMSPTATLFGDTVAGRLEVTVDRRKIDPGRIRVKTVFTPYSAVGAPTRVRRDVGDLTYLTYRVTLRCLTSGCVPNRQRRVVFPPASVTYPAVGNGTRTTSLAVAWPALEVYSRVDRVELARVDPRDVAPWRGDLTALPQVSYSVGPDLVRWLLVGGGLVLLLAGGVLLVRLLPRRAPTPVKDAPEPIPLTPLEQALLVVEAAGTRSVAERRTALELLAGRLDEPDAATLADDARRLAWSESAPAPKTTKGLVARVRNLIDERARAHSA